ncbi:S-adenosylmethionine mitochondrial carrier protein isoform X2 [Canis lupus familiaris]|uniref:S-adenosylmethionine mitochondrial carrier protein isoform X2 n=1 Tax=Canis lupus dingo TaxID=286419 RepID=UPI000BAA3377|nr:S-adenosylmethionine mitochondrial carrier protein isoform X2 [Canis lupus dingo]XP_038283120.1 S-adenosylmethionine mitochondrial carrier protein isoform X2 [Canis lupus familiaris]XP_038310784.1 S-adenosylmethionine mitochondrial carrier protein isoform X2 [Canis lupus familiaris]XP_038421822.1 S-adenosylmethionine mitochondrial carrier protein isoform X2 [Canis lupus familiaris]|eukprot:XP_022262176.1 S-adenosylmethionine mitochondrial carrier protein isoform X2 [Canis lupus familiaris]
MPNRLSHLGAPPASFKIEDLRTFCACNVAGGVAGVAVDLILFPLDTIKTRLQSPQGFNKAGGFRGIYAGVPSAAIGSFPNAAAFFITYEYVKWFLHTDSSSYLMPVKHMLAASAGEVVACLIRVPSEVVKQRAQVSASSRTFQIFSNILYTEGIQGLYRGYKSTVLREALWSWRQDHVVDCWQSAVCGAFAGGFAAAVTTPLDVAKTRIMLAKTFCKQVGLFLRVTDLRPRELTCFMLCSRLVPAPLAAMYSLRCTGSGGRRGCQDYLQVSSLERQPSVWEVSSFLVLMSKPAACCWNLAERAPDSGRCPMLCSQERGRRASSCSRQARRSVQQPTWCETEPAVAAQGLGGRGGPTEDLSPPPREPQRRGLGQRGDSTISPRLVRYQHQQPLP